MLIGLLPPLLYAAAIRTSLVDIKANRRAIGLLAVGLVIFTTAIVGLVAWWLLPIPLAAAFAFGAVVAPPDAVAATAIARRIGLPRRVVTVLEGESLLNDATALVALRTAIVALTGVVSVGSITLDFLWAAAGGAAIGVAVALVIASVRKHIKDPTIDTARVPDGAVPGLSARRGTARLRRHHGGHRRPDPRATRRRSSRTPPPGRTSGSTGRPSSSCWRTASSC